MPGPIVLTLRPISPASRERFRALFPDGSLIDANSDDERRSLLERAEIAFGVCPARWLERADRLRWLHSAFAGVSIRLCEVARAKGFIVTNSAGIFSQSVAEHALALMLALSRGLDILHWRQRWRSWSAPTAPTPQNLAGQTAGIVGVGGIGRAIARLCRAFGMQTIGCRRTLQPTPFIDRLYDSNDLVAMARSCSWLVVAAPLTPRTKGLVNADVLAALPPGGRVINVSRGAVIDEGALVAQLRSGRLAGAGLDVTEREPLDPRSPLWELPNVILTPHVASIDVDRSDAAFDLFLRNLSACVAGDSMTNVVDLNEGY